MTWRDLNASVEALGLQDLELGEVHLLKEASEPEITDIEIFKNFVGTLTVHNSVCR